MSTKFRVLSALSVLVLLSLSLVPASAAPLDPDAPDGSRLGPELQLSPDGDANRFKPAVAADYEHNQYIVVWHNTWGSGLRDIYARRVSAQGKLLSWFCVATGAGGDGKSRLLPDVVYNPASHEWLVVYMLEASPGVYEIWGRRVAWDGSSMGAETRIYTWANRSFWSPKVAYNPYRNEYMVAWNAFDTSGGLPGVPVDIAGVAMSATLAWIQYPASLFVIYANPHQMDMVYNIAMDEYFIVYVVVNSALTTGNDIYGLRVRWDGVPVNPPGMIQIAEIAKDQNAPAVATNGQDRYMVVWEDAYTASDHDIYGREYDANGNPIGASFSLASWTEDTTAPDIAASGSPGSQWLATWQEALPAGSGYAVKAFRWGPGVFSTFFDVAAYAYWENEAPAVAARRPGYLIAYEGDSSITPRHIYGRLWWPEVLYVPVVLRNQN